MKYFFNGVLSSLKSIIVYVIPISFVVTLIIFFLLHNDPAFSMSFLEFWLMGYAILGSIYLITGICIPLLFRLVLGLEYSVQFKSSLSNVFEAFMEHNLAKNEGWMYWDPETFARFLETEREYKKHIKPSCTGW